MSLVSCVHWGFSDAHFFRSALQRTGLRRNSPTFVSDDVAGAGTPRYAEAVLVLRLLERADVVRLGMTCRGWRTLCKSYLSEWRRTRLVLELRDTERTFVLNMRDVIERYMVTRTVGSKVLDDEETFRLFANTEDLYRLNTALYRRLQGTVAAWTASSCVAGAFDGFEPAVDLYRVYSRNQTRALEFAEQLRFELRISDLDWRLLESFLIQPIQRIPRYQMLLREIGQNSPKGHPEHELVGKAQGLLTEVGRAMEHGMELAAAEKVPLSSSLPFSSPDAGTIVWPRHAWRDCRCAAVDAAQHVGLRVLC